MWPRTYSRTTTIPLIFERQITHHREDHLGKSKPIAATTASKTRPNKASHPLAYSDPCRHPRISTCVTTTTTLYKPQSCPKPTSAKGIIFPNKRRYHNSSTDLPTQTKPRLPLRPAIQSLRPAQRHNRHLRQCARPARHRQHFRVLLEHDDEPERKRKEIGSDGEPGE
jgi:hypothetical protein